MVVEGLSGLLAEQILVRRVGVVDGFDNQLQAHASHLISSVSDIKCKGQDDARAKGRGWVPVSRCGERSLLSTPPT